MLKIKDNVDLKELIKKLDKKYKFIEIYYDDKNQYWLLTVEKHSFMSTDWKGKKFKNTEDFSWQIWKEDRLIRYMAYNKPSVEFVSYSVCEEFDFIYDLIQDGVVEKVGGANER